MVATKKILILSILILMAYCCPKNCVSCTADPAKCEQCSPGYTLDPTTFECGLDYDKQAEWGGSCNTGSKQTPINIVSSDATKCSSGAQFFQDILTSTVNISPSGIDLTASYVDQSTVKFVRGETTKTFNSLQFHWHHPSEHTVDGKSFDLELHIVHTNADGSTSLSVTGLFFNVDNTITNDVLDEYNFFKTANPTTFKFPINLKDRNVYHYEGSLTTPPCS